MRSLVKSVQKMLSLTGFLMHDFSEPLIYVTFRVSQMEIALKTLCESISRDSSFMKYVK